MSGRLSTKYYYKGKEWVDAKKVADLLEESKSAYLSQMIHKLLGDDTPVNRAEIQAKASAEWGAYLNQMVEARAKANLLSVELASLKMRSGEEQSEEATARAEMRL